MSGDLRTNLGRLRGRILDVGAAIEHGRMHKDVRLLMFHRIGAPRSLLQNNEHVGEKEFEDIISSLSEVYQFVSVDEVAEWLKGKTDIPDRSVALTFDDGFVSVKKAINILESFDAPATVYIPSNYVGLSPNLADLTLYLKDNDEAEFLWEDERYSFNLTSEDKMIEAFNQISGICQGKESSQVRKIISSIISKNYIGADKVYLSEQDLKRIDKHELISIGSHSADHRKLTDLEPEEARKSIEQSKEDLEEVLDHEVNSFSFPFGAKNRELVEMVEEAGYENAVVTEGRKVSERDWGNVYRIPRVDGKDL